MNKSVLALSTALSIFAFAPAFAQEQAPAVQDPNCVEQNQGTGSTTAIDPNCVNRNADTQNNAQSTGTGTDQNTTTTTTGQTTEPMAPDASTTTTTGQTTTTTPTEPTDTDAATTTTTTTTGETGSQMSGSLIVPADQLSSARLMSANDFIGKTVYDQTGANIGEVNDMIVSGDGNVEAVILGVGGFLGIGEKDVAVNTDAIKMVQDGNSQRLVVEATKETLEQAPTYDRANRRYATDGTMTTDDPATGTTGTIVDTNNDGIADPAPATGTGTTTTTDQ